MTTVSRSTYQKVVEENKRLKEDIKILVKRETAAEILDISRKWLKIFREEDALLNNLKSTTTGSNPVV